MKGPCSKLYQTGVRFRHFLYDRQLIQKKFAKQPVISIGNVVAGGTGKTQVALFLADLLSRDYKTAILSRGYRSHAEHAKDPLVVDICKHNFALCGDEPWLLASRLGSTFVVVNKNRFKSAQKAEQLGAQVLILDDGMQHRKLHRDFEIVVVDGKRPLKHFLPKGELREDLNRLKGANLILFMGTPSEELEKQVASYTSAPHVVMRITPQGIFHINGEAIETVNGKKIALFCGIGNPQRFVQTIEELGASVVASFFSPDHCLLTKRQMEQFSAFAAKRGATLLLCTEKDKVKLCPNSRDNLDSGMPFQDLPLPIGWIRTTLEIVQNQHIWLKTVNEIKLLVSRQL
jgi:tetraacyldisaccharide 4'-kinase